MTLTEEQRAALKRVAAYMDEMYSVASPYHGCTEDSDLLRAMIDSSGTVEPTGGFDLEKARAGIAHYRIENPSNVDTESALKELVDQANLAEDALAEIERLRASLIDLHAEYINTLEKNPECSAWDLDEQSDADQRRLRKNAAHAISIVEPLIYLQADQQAAHIQELEDALVEYLAADIAYAAGVLWSRLGPRKEEYRERARQQLQAGGKIGTGARPPCWQITEDRVTAIDQGLRFLEWSNAINGSVETKKHIATLQTMLEETGDKNGFEGRNKMRIETIR